MQLQFTAVFRKVPEGYMAFVEELPGANTQGETLEEARANLQEAVALTFEANRGQTSPRVRFLARGKGYMLFLTPDDAVLSLADRDRAGRARRRAQQPQSGHLR